MLSWYDISQGSPWQLPQPPEAHRLLDLARKAGSGREVGMPGIAGNKETAIGASSLAMAVCFALLDRPLDMRAKAILL